MLVCAPKKHKVMHVNFSLITSLSWGAVITQCLCVVSGGDKQKCCVSHLFLGRPDRTESSENLRLVRKPSADGFSSSFSFPISMNIRLSVLSYHCHLYPHPENDEERADVLDSLRTRIQDLNNVSLECLNMVPR